MFRISLVNKLNNKEISLFDKVQEDFNEFNIDVVDKTLVAYIIPNFKNGYNDMSEVIDALKSWWNMDKINYQFMSSTGSVKCEIKIPDGSYLNVKLK